MKKCIVIGGGFAGLSAAAYLAANGVKVTLLEASPKSGGRAYSYTDKSSGDIVDNGQHILMGCYKETLAFLKLIGALKNFYFQKTLNVNFLKSKSEKFTLRTSLVFYPLNLLIAILNFKAVSIRERIGIVLLFLKLIFTNSKNLKNISVEDWLKQIGQSENAILCFWGIISIGTLNTSVQKASAEIFADILKKIFLNGNRNSKIILPAKGLSESYCHDAVSFITGNSGEVRLSESVDRIRFSGKKIISLGTSSGEITDFDYVISAVPHYALLRIKGSEEFNNPNFIYSSILTFHIWLSDDHAQLVSKSSPQNKFPERVRNETSKSTQRNDFFCLIDSRVQWVFDKGTHLTLVISDADDLIKKNDDELKTIAISELIKFTHLSATDIKDVRILKEKRATFIPSSGIIDNRPSTGTSYENFFLAGDWVNTGLPSTIESAVMSGKMAANSVI